MSQVGSVRRYLTPDCTEEWRLKKITIRTSNCSCDFELVSCKQEVSKLHQEWKIRLDVTALPGGGLEVVEKNISGKTHLGFSLLC